MTDTTPGAEPDTTAQDAAEAAQAEAQGAETVTIEWRELTPFEIPYYRHDWPFLAVVAAQRAEWPTMLYELLPASTLDEIGRLRLTAGDVTDDLLTTMFQKLGIATSGE